MNHEKQLYTLIPIEDFKAYLSVDDREDKLCRFCLVTSSLSIEQYCKRKLLRKKHFERIGFFGDLLVTLREYPVSNVLAVYTIGNREWGVGSGEFLETEFYRVLPDCGTDIDIPFSIEFSPAVARIGCKAIKVVYWAGYAPNNVPADLSAACLSGKNSFCASIEIW